MFWATQVTVPIEVAGVRTRNTSLANEATQFVSGVTPLFWLLNHLLSACVFAELPGSRGAIKYDSELLYLGAIMHDLGLTDEFAGIQRLELDGAAAASRLLQEHDVWKLWIQQGPDVLGLCSISYAARDLGSDARGNCSPRLWRSCRLHRYRNRKALRKAGARGA